MSRKTYYDIKKLEYYSIIGLLNNKDKKKKETELYIKRQINYNPIIIDSRNKKYIQPLIKNKASIYMNSYSLNFIFK